MHLLVYLIQKVQQWFWRSPKKGRNCLKSLRTVRRRHFLLYKGYNVLLKKTKYNKSSICMKVKRKLYGKVCPSMRRNRCCPTESLKYSHRHTYHTTPS